MFFVWQVTSEWQINNFLQENIKIFQRWVIFCFWLFWAELIKTWWTFSFQEECQISFLLKNSRWPSLENIQLGRIGQNIMALHSSLVSLENKSHRKEWAAGTLDMFNKSWGTSLQEFTAGKTLTLFGAEYVIYCSFPHFLK